MNGNDLTFGLIHKLSNLVKKKRKQISIIWATRTLNGLCYHDDGTHKPTTTTRLLYRENNKLTIHRVNHTFGTDASITSTILFLCDQN